MKSKNAVYRVSEFASKVGMSTETTTLLSTSGQKAVASCPLTTLSSGLGAVTPVEIL